MQRLQAKYHHTDLPSLAATADYSHVVSDLINIDSQATGVPNHGASSGRGYDRRRMTGVGMPREHHAMRRAFARWGAVPPR